MLKRLAIGCIVMIGCIVEANNAPGIESIRFPERAWDFAVLRRLDAGPRYLNPNLEFDISPPAANDSGRVKAELTLLRDYEMTARTESEKVLIVKEAANANFIDTFLGGDVVAAPLAKISRRLLLLADRECVYFVLKYKKRFSRARPSMLDSRLLLVVPNPGHAAYPSGHATQAMLMALILAKIDPNNEQQYVRYARAIAKRREIAGVHFPSNSDAGQLLAPKILAALSKIPEFKTELSAALKAFRD